MEGDFKDQRGGRQMFLPRPSRGGGNPVFFCIQVFYGVSSPYDEAFLFRQKDPKPLMPDPASLDELEANSWRADQLAWLK